MITLTRIGDYMTRLVFETRWGSVRFHYIKRSDSDRHLHDHPWDFTSFVLWGGYIEVMPLNVRYVKPLSVVRHRAEDLHALILDKPALTMVLCGPRRREWGFKTENGWVHWKDYDLLRQAQYPQL